MLVNYEVLILNDESWYPNKNINIPSYKIKK